jgi:hypothetical protein
VGDFEESFFFWINVIRKEQFQIKTNDKLTKLRDEI